MILTSVQGQHSRAEALYQQALEGQERQLGSEHPATLGTMSCLATVYSRQGQHSRAEALYQQALEGQERQLGSEHPATLRTIVMVPGLIGLSRQSRVALGNHVQRYWLGAPPIIK